MAGPNPKCITSRTNLQNLVYNVPALIILNNKTKLPTVFLLLRRIRKEYNGLPNNIRTSHSTRS